MNTIKEEFEIQLPNHLSLFNKGTVKGECLIWNGYISHDGYGRIKVNYKQWTIHRFVGSLLFGDLNNLCICHINECSSRACYRPSHLYKGTKADNIRDAREKGTYNSFGGNISKRKTYCMYGHRLEAGNLYINKKGERHCKKCALENSRLNR